MHHDPHEPGVASDASLVAHANVHGPADLDIPCGSLEAAALADLPYSFEPRAPRTAFYRDCFA
ncbi:hypothetical protein [Cupriavidus sp. AU9028]|uniref:hypothetical protein n=1 Tax=Cupriavidus sp. AU9028 TaxID=2871157 RepID=UPI001C98564B|nr:hypothetical protein [Cupriavidus sp. AU9028]MBY4896836.1 hypothetical protein [Cupriavidus sp. AU9028]